MIRDDNEPLRQIFYFSSVGPVYMSEEQKQIDYQYMDMGGYAIPWIAYGLQIIGLTSPKREFRNKVHDIIAEKKKNFLRIWKLEKSCYFRLSMGVTGCWLIKM